MAGLPNTGPASAEGSAQALVTSPTAEVAGALASDTDPNDTQNLALLLVFGVMAIPGLIVITLIATVLIRR